MPLEKRKAYNTNTTRTKPEDFKALSCLFPSSRPSSEKDATLTRHPQPQKREKGCTVYKSEEGHHVRPLTFSMETKTLALPFPSPCLVPDQINPWYP